MTVLEGWRVDRSSPALVGVSFSLAAAALVGYLVLWRRKAPGERCGEAKSKDKEPKLYFKPDSELHQYILRNCPMLKEPFIPAWWARNPHVQCILPSLRGGGEGVRYRRETLEQEDGGVVAIDWAEDDTGSLTASSPVLLILPSLTGDAVSFSPLSRQALDSGFRPLVINKRGHGGAPLLTPRMTSYGDPEDMRLVVLAVRERFPEAPVTMYGASAGTGQIACYLAEYGADPVIRAGVAESSGYDAIKLYGGGIHPVYEWVMMRLLRRLVTSHRAVLEKAVDVDSVLASSSIAQFEERLYARLYGFPTPREYWEKNNAVGARGNITIPLLCINSLDDPVCHEFLIPYRMFLDHPRAMLVTTRHGGHCGFRYGLGSRSWAHCLGLQYLRAALDSLELQTSKPDQPGTQNHVIQPPDPCPPTSHANSLEH